LSDWASSAFSGGSVNIQTLISELENEICAAYTFPNTTVLASTSSGTAVSRTSTSRTLLVDELAVFITSMSVSAASAGTEIETQHYINGSAIAGSTQHYIEHADGASVNGGSASITNISKVVDLAGSGIVFDLQWRKSAGPGTIYSRRANGILLILKRRE
jgi:hypothetical protein